MPGFDLSRLDPGRPSAALYAALGELRARHLRRAGRIEDNPDLLRKVNELVRRLVALLSRPNSKVVEVTLSILANLLTSEAPRKAIRDKEVRGLSVLVGILSTLGEEGILNRAARAVANASQDLKNANLLHSEDVVEVLLKVLGDAKEAKTKQVVVRAFRILGATAEQKRRILDAGAISAITSIMLEVGKVGVNEQSKDAEELLRASLRCLGHFTHGCNEALYAKIHGENGEGLRRLSELTRHPRRQVWESALSCVVNLSHLHRFRPALGNAGFVVAVADKVRGGGEELSEREAAHCVTALCLYCRESVNRMKLRECGGLGLLVAVLGDADKARLHDRVVNSLLQYSYDESSLRVLQREGLVPRLTDLLERWTEENAVAHDCAREICEADEDEEEEEDKMSSVHEEEEEGTAAGAGNTAGSENVEGDASADAVAIDAAQRSEADVDGSNPLDLEVQAAFSDESKEPNVAGPSQPTSVKGPSTPPRQYRVNSPSYQAVQHEFEEYLRIQTEMKRQQETAQPFSMHFPDVPWSSDSPGCSRWQSPDRSPIQWSFSSPGYSPMHSPMSGASSEAGSPSRSFGASPAPGSPISFGDATPPHSPSNEQTASPPSTEEKKHEEKEDANEVQEAAAAAFEYSPVETFSDDDKDDPFKPSSSSRTDQTLLSSPPQEKRRRLSSNAAKLVLPSQEGTSGGYKSIFSPSYEASFNDFSLPGPSSPTSSERSLSQWRPLPRPKKSNSKDSSNEDTRAGWIIQILSRLSQAERPHEDMASLRTMQVLVGYLARVKNPIPRAGRILARLSKNLYCITSFVFQRHLSWLKLYLDARPTMPDSVCQGCRDLFLVRSNISQNVSLLAETGYAEGQMCHVLARGGAKDKTLVSISAPMLVRSRKILNNIMLAHEGLEFLLEFLESSGKEKGKGEKSKREDQEEPDPLFSDAVLSCSFLAAHIGIVAPNLKLNANAVGDCHFNEESAEVSGQDDDDLVVFVLDDGAELRARRSRVSGSSGVFSAMFGGAFAESGRRRVPLPGAGRETSVKLLLHHLYGCRWCPAFEDVDVASLLELVALSDQFLLPDLNKTVAREIVLRCMNVSQVVSIYEGSLRGNYSVSGCEESLASCAVNYLLVGAMEHRTRVSVFRELMASNMAGDFADDVSKGLRQKLLESR